MPGDRESLSGEISGDRHRQGSCSFSCAIGTDVQRDEDRNAGEKLDGAGDIQSLSSCKETIVGGEFWSDGYFASTVGKHGNETMIGRYVESQGKEYHKFHSDHQLSLF